jgi:hypothetical protein
MEVWLKRRDHSILRSSRTSIGAGHPSRDPGSDHDRDDAYDDSEEHRMMLFRRLEGLGATALMAATLTQGGPVRADAPLPSIAECAGIQADCSSAMTPTASTTGDHRGWLREISPVRPAALVMLDRGGSGRRRDRCYRR